MDLNIAMAKTSAILREEMKNLDLRMDSFAKAMASLREEMSQKHAETSAALTALTRRR